MRIVMIGTGDRRSAPGIQLGDSSVLPLSSLLGGHAPATIAETIARRAEIQEALDRRALAGDEPALGHQSLPFDSVDFRAPCDPGVLLVCAGSNYRSHVAEMNEDGNVSTKATTFIKSSNAVIGSHQSIVVPRQLPDMVDFEGEICVVFDRPCHNVSVADAMSYVGGYTILNDISARDSVPAMLAAVTPAEGQAAMLEMMMGKHLPTFAPIGPAIVTSDEIVDPGKLRLVTQVNGVTMQDATTADLVLDVPNLIAQMSGFYLFRPGDILSTGTPAGVGFGRKPPAFLKPGDTVTVEVTGLGKLENSVRAASD